MTERTLFSGSEVAQLLLTSILGVIYLVLRLRVMSAAVSKVLARD